MKSNVKVKATAACDTECSLLNDVTVTETTIRLQFNNSSTRMNARMSATFQNGSTVGDSGNNSISGLYPGLQYIIHFNNTIEACCKYIFTKPGPVHSIHAENITNTTLNLSWKNDDINASNYTYRIDIDGLGDLRNKSSNKWSVPISNLQPGMSYRFKIYPQVDGGKTEGNPSEAVVYTKPNPVSSIHANNPNSTSIILTWNRDTKEISLRTKPSPVYDIKAENITNASLDLTWKNNDTNSSNYTYRISIDGPGRSDNITSNTTYVSISDLEPGTSYKFEIYAQVDGNQIEGDPNEINVYTKPSPVYDIKAEKITNTSLDLTWNNNDTNSSNYTYRIYIDGPGGFNKTSNTTHVSISDLEPGTSYKFEIYAQVDGNQTEGDPQRIKVHTRPSPVYDIEFENVTTTTLDIKFKCLYKAQSSL
ncbi:receptor-type tyrosine-protein phosphatase eta [Crotalus adamanteus]|uniref:Receptor-type tyrosine-protein phosphatase eta n=1 Tax=Crotalus adamanteus TaxID=8729 RepID=A0AAW1C7P7_CROAD